MPNVRIMLATAVLLLCGGCVIPLQPIPGPGRNGQHYCYTRDYRDNELGFCLLGKALTATINDGHWGSFFPS